MPKNTPPTSTSITQDIPAPRLDSQGNHLQLYGKPTAYDAPSLRNLGVARMLQVASRREKQRYNGRPQVVLLCSDAPWTFDFRLTADAARAMAASLLNAADACDTLDRRLGVNGKPRKTTAHA